MNSILTGINLYVAWTMVDCSIQAARKSWTSDETGIRLAAVLALMANLSMVCALVVQSMHPNTETPRVVVHLADVVALCFVGGCVLYATTGTWALLQGGGGMPAVQIIFILLLIGMSVGGLVAVVWCYTLDVRKKALARFVPITAPATVTPAIDV